MTDRFADLPRGSNTQEPVARDTPERSSAQYQDRITRDPAICGGEPVIKGTRVPLRTILASLAEGDRFEEILKDFPTLTAEDLRAVVAHAAASTNEHTRVLAFSRAS